MVDDILYRYPGYVTVTDPVSLRMIFFRPERCVRNMRSSSLSSIPCNPSEVRCLMSGSRLATHGDVIRVLDKSISNNLQIAYIYKSILFPIKICM